jgi:signal transduction histidine kinase
MSSNVKTITDTDGHEKSFFAYQYGPTGARGGMSCFDWNTQAHCSELPWLKYWYNMNDAVSADQGYAYDGSCMIGMSKQGFLWSFNTKTAESPCRVARTKFTASFDANKFYCDGQSHAFGWQSARLSKSSMFDFEQYNVRAYSAQGGALRASGDIKDTGSLDLSSIDFSQQSSLYIDVDSNVWSPSPWANGKLPYASIRASGDDVQYCYTTRAKTYQEDIACDITKLGTASSAVFVTDDNTFTKDKSQTVDYLQPGDKQCFKDLRVSVQPNKTRVNNGEQITYTITVDNKANPDPHNRGDIGGLFNPKTAQYEATLPTGMQFVSASNGGTLSQDGTKVIWASRSLAALASDSVSVVLQAPGPTAKAKSKTDIVLAASVERTLNMSAAAIYDDDVYQSDNTVASQPVTFENNASPVVDSLVQTTNNPRAPATLHFTVNATDENNIASVELLNGSDVVGTMTATTTANQYEITLSNIPEGSYSFTARATDDGTPALSSTSSAVSVSVRAENVGPSLSNFSQLTNNPRAPATLNFVIEATDIDGLASVALLSENDQPLGTMTATSTPNQYGISLQNYAAGDYVFKVRATDGASPALSTTSSTISLTVLPNLPPVITGVSQTIASPRAPAALNIVATITDDNGISAARLLDGNNQQIGTMTATSTPNQYGISLQNYAAGDLVFKVRATDGSSPAQTTTSGSISVTVLPDTPPALSGFTQTNTSLRAPAELHFVITATDNAGVGTVQLLGTNDTVLGVMQSTGQANQYEATLTGVLEGAVTYRVKAADTAQQPNISFSSSLSVTVDAAPTPPPPLTPGTTTVTPTNSAPVISDFVQLTNKPQAPAALQFEVKVSDDSGVANVVLFADGQQLGTMLATTTSGKYAFRTDDYKEGSYEFQVKATDNGSPAITTTSDKLTVTVTAKPETPVGSGGTNNSNNTVAQTYTPVAIRSIVPEFAKSNVETGFRVLASTVQPVSPTTAKALPYATIGMLIATSGVYMVLAYNQIRNRNQLRKIIDRFKKAEQGRKNYIQLTSHYINTPIAVMKGTVELLQVKKKLAADLAKNVMRYLNRLSSSAQQLLEGDETVAQQTKQTEQLLRGFEPKHLIKDPAVVIPIVSGIFLIVLLNSLFVWSKKYGASVPNFALQSALLVAGGVAMVLALRFLRQQKFATQAVTNELSLEQLIQDKQSQFIKTNGDELTFDIGQIQQFTPAISTADPDKRFTSGLHDISYAVERLRYLDELTKAQKTTANPIQLRVPTELLIRNAQEKARQKEVGITLDMAADVSARIDEKAYRQLLTSTLDNAVKFSNKGGTVELQISSKHHQTQIKIIDKGVGIAKDKLNQLFNAFSRATDTETFDYEGMGIDLYMDKLIVDKFGGTIDVASELGKGTTVTIVLPSEG